VKKGKKKPSSLSSECPFKRGNRSGGWKKTLLRTTKEVMSPPRSEGERKGPSRTEKKPLGERVEYPRITGFGSAEKP